MDPENQIDLKRFIPKKASKFYMLKILLYTILLITLGYILIHLMKKENKKPDPIEEIKGVEIELN